MSRVKHANLANNQRLSNKTIHIRAYMYHTFKVQASRNLNSSYMYVTHVQ